MDCVTSFAMTLFFHVNSRLAKYIAIIRGFAGKTPLPDQLLSGELRKCFGFRPDLPETERLHILDLLT